MSLLIKAKIACRVSESTVTYNDELTSLIEAALADLGITDIDEAKLTEEDTDPLIERAVMTYCKMNFGFAVLTNDQYDRLKSSYDEQKSQLLMSSSYTNWGNSNA
jgi:hypothetical protein